MSDRKNSLESYVSSKLEQVYKYSRPTIASGATPVEKGDIKNPYFLIECKIRNTNSFSIKDNVWYKLKGEAAQDQGKDPVYIIENVKGNRLAIMDLEDFFNLIYELCEYRENDKLMKTTVQECPYCGSTKALKFPCCGYFCMNCGKTFEEEKEDGNNNLSKL